uniref:Uncharacterized protein LOC104232129 n=1 Tax=Nicotiana sylvestris TaxID=4096 RepID=A0A1U7XAR5_NICSY|nr:PREDICTED: uncharacterized protein LOC104232129 [Nicotiana sylvestris]
MSKSGFDKHIEHKEAPWLSEYNFSIIASGIVSAIGQIKDIRWPRPLQTDPSQRNPNQMFKYHGTHGHRTEDCRQLMEEVARLFNEGHLREFLNGQAKNHFRDMDANRKNKQEEPQHVIHMIVGGVSIPQGTIFKRRKVTITREKRTRDYLPKDTLSFNNDYAKGIEQPHNDALQSLFDRGSENNSASRIESCLQLEYSTTSTWQVKPPKGKSFCHETIQEMKFHVIEGDMIYNALLGRPWIHNMKAVPSMLYQVLKFPMSEGIKTMYGEQPTTKEMFAIDEVVPISTLSSAKGSEPKRK